jgi:micrococcal nuclease
MKVKIMFIVLLIGIMLINGCAQQKGESTQALPSQEESEIGESVQALPPQEESEIGESVQELPLQVDSEIGRLEQAEKILEELDALYVSERDMLRKMYEDYVNELEESCVDELCFEIWGELIEFSEEEEIKILELKSIISDEILDKGQYTNVDLVDLYEELSKNLSTTAQEGRFRFKDYYENLSSTTSTITYKVTNVIDGDTIEINTGEIVRLIGINAPEEGGKCYEESKEYLQDFLSDKEVTLEMDIEDKDQYGRLLRYVFADGHHVNYGMVYLGLAHKYEYGLNKIYSSQFEQAEDEAKQNEGCLWESEEVSYILDECIQITNLHFNAAGDDNYNLNDEYITFENKCSYSISMDSWTIKDETASHIYTIPSFAFQSGATFTLYTGTGTNTNSALYWGRTSEDYAAIWNNNGDTLFLRDSSGNLVLSQSYSGY